MPARHHQSADETSGAVDLLYFPPARHISGPPPQDVRCHESIASALTLKKECGLGYVFVTPCKHWSCDRRIYCADIELDDVLRYTAPHPQHFIGIAGYNPLAIAGSAHQAEIGIKHHGFKGVYVNPGSFGISLWDRRMYPLYVKALDWKVPVILDASVAGDAQPIPVDTLEQIAGDFPALSFVIANSPWTAREMLDLADGASNIHFCLDSASLVANGRLDFANSACGESRLMWGSNGQPWKQALAAVSRLRLRSPRSLLRDNALRIFGVHLRRKRKAKPYHEIEHPEVRIVAE